MNSTWTTDAPTDPGWQWIDCKSILGDLQCLEVYDAGRGLVVDAGDEAVKIEELMKAGARFAATAPPEEDGPEPVKVKTTAGDLRIGEGFCSENTDFTGIIVSKGERTVRMQSSAMSGDGRYYECEVDADMPVIVWRPAETAGPTKETP